MVKTVNNRQISSALVSPESGGRNLKAWSRVIVSMGAVMFLVLLLVYGFTRDARYIKSPLIGRQAPDFTLTRFDGVTLNLKDFRGKAVLVNFWASWCLECRVEAPALEAGWQRHWKEDVVYVGVNMQDKEPDARAFLKEFGISYPNGWDASGRAPVDFGVWGIPETFFLNKQGRITYKHVGAIDEETIVAKIKEAAHGVVSAGEGRGGYELIR